MPRFAFCNVPPLQCPGCGTTEFGDYSIRSLRVWWGLAVAQVPIPRFDYELGDRIRWRSCLEGAIHPWTFFRDHSLNIGDPRITDVIVLDDLPSRRCSTCGTYIGGGAVRITGGRITEARLFVDGEFGDDELVDTFVVLPDGSIEPITEPESYGRATAACGPLEAIESIPKAVVAVLLPPPSRHWLRRSSLPPAWTDVVEHWLSAQGAGTVSAGALGTEVEIAPCMVGEFAESHGGGTFLTGDPRSECRAAVMRHWRTAAELILAGGGADADVGALADELCDLVDRFAPDVAHAYVSIESTFASVVTLSELSDESVFSDDGTYRPRFMVSEACDEVVLDAYHHQVLGPGHLARLGGPPDGSKVLPAGRVSLTLGSPSDWEIESATPGRAALRDRGREILGSLMLDQDQMKGLIEGPTAEEIRQLFPNLPAPPTP